MTNKDIKDLGGGIVAKLIDRTGEVYGILQIVRELGNNKVVCKCTKCESLNEYNKKSVVSNAVLCKNCGTRGAAKIINMTGNIFNNIQIIAELGKGYVICKCLLCGSEKKYYKNKVISGASKSCECTQHKLINRTGQIFNNLKIIKELGKGRVLAECMLCSSIKEYEKGKIVKGIVKSCRCIPGGFKDRTGEIINNLQIIKELRDNKVIARCIICNFEHTYDKGEVVRGEKCKSCGMGKGYKNRIINNVKVIDLAYTGRNNKKYYICVCSKCGEELVLTREEIVNYVCNK